MKKALLFFPIFILLTAFNCENEPLEGEFQTEATVCFDTTQELSIASANFVNAIDSNYEELCNAYKIALQNQISACGDDNGSIQTIINSLGDCTIADPDTCESATTAANVGLSNLNSAPDDQYTTFCNAYIMALENKIELCGDTDGSIQAEIDALGNCTLSTTNGNGLISVTVGTFNRHGDY